MATSNIYNLTSRANTGLINRSHAVCISLLAYETRIQAIFQQLQEQKEFYYQVGQKINKKHSLLVRSEKLMSTEPQIPVEFTGGKIGKYSELSIAENNKQIHNLLVTKNKYQ